MWFCKDVHLWICSARVLRHKPVKITPRPTPEIWLAGLSKSQINSKMVQDNYYVPVTGNRLSASWTGILRAMFVYNLCRLLIVCLCVCLRATLAWAHQVHHDRMCLRILFDKTAKSFPIKGFAFCWHVTVESVIVDCKQRYQPSLQSYYVPPLSWLAPILVCPCRFWILDTPMLLTDRQVPRCWIEPGSIKRQQRWHDKMAPRQMLAECFTVYTR